MAAGVSPDTIFNRPPEAIDFEAFARALNVDHSMTPWPPLPPNVGSAGSHFDMGMLGMGMSGSADSGNLGSMNAGAGMSGTDDMWNGWGNGLSMQSSGGDFGGGHATNDARASQHTSTATAPLGRSEGMAYHGQARTETVGMTQQGGNTYDGSGGQLPLGLESWVAQQGLNLSSSGLGPGVGDFIGAGVGDGEGMGFMNEAFWQTVFNGRGQGL
jgi:hypothetical protein